MTKLLSLVHCHLCVLKDLCDYEASEASYKFQHWEGREKFPLSKAENAKLDVAKQNCPIKRKILGLAE